MSTQNKNLSLVTPAPTAPGSLMRRLSGGVAPSVPISHHGNLGSMLQQPGSNGISMLGKFVGKGDAAVREAAEAAERGTEEKRQKEAIEEISKGIRGTCTLRLLLSLDFTASTSGDIQNIITEADALVKKLREAFPKGVEVLPVAVSGGGMFGPQVILSKINDLQAYRSISNVAYINPTPVAHGVTGGVKDGFFRESRERQVQAAVTIGDDEFELPSDYDEHVVQNFIRRKIALAGLVTVGSISAVGSHKRGITDRLGELGIVVQRNRSEMSAIDLIYNFLINQRENMIHEIARKEHAKRPIAAGKPIVITQPKPVSFADFLHRSGFTHEARNVFQGDVAGYLGNR